MNHEFEFEIDDVRELVRSLFGRYSTAVAAAEAEIDSALAFEEYYEGVCAVLRPLLPRHITRAEMLAVWATLRGLVAVRWEMTVAKRA